MTNTTATVYVEAFQPLKPLLVEQFTDYVTKTLARYVQQWDELSKRPGFRTGQDGTWRFVRGFAKMDSNRMSARPFALDAERLERIALQNAEAQINEFAHKLFQKLGAIGEFEATFARGGNFHIKGVVNGHSVHVDQQTIFKISSHGNPFNQFPARIYVDGKFTPAKAYSEAVE